MSSKKLDDGTYDCLVGENLLSVRIEHTDDASLLISHEGLL